MAGTAAADPARGDAGEVWQVDGLSIERARSWGAVSATAFGRTGRETLWRSRRHRLLLILDPGDSWTVEIEGGATLAGRYAKGGVGFYPAERAVRAVHPDSWVRMIQVLQDAAVYGSVATEMGGSAEIDLEPLVPVHDPLVSQLIQSVAQEAEGGPANRLIVDALNTALAVQIARRFVRWTPPEIHAGSLPGKRLRRVLDYIEANLATELTLAELAAVACLSPFHFSRCFKRATGMGLQRYVTERRIARAKALMGGTDQPLAAIAQAVGFADQSHFTTAFRRATGTTPGRFRLAAAA